MRKDLVLTRGNTKPIDFDFLDENDLPESLVGADKAAFNVKISHTSLTSVLSRDTDAGNLSINPSTSTVTATLTEVESLALPVGVFLGQIAVRYGDDDSWFYSDLFRVKIQPNVAERI